mgnify:CR=1 FL=1
MKKFYITFFIFICTIGMIACGNQNVSQDVLLESENVEEGTVQQEEKI